MSKRSSNQRYTLSLPVSGNTGLTKSRSKMCPKVTDACRYAYIYWGFAPTSHQIFAISVATFFATFGTTSYRVLYAYIVYLIIYFVGCINLSNNGFSAGVRGLQAFVYKGLSKMCGISLEDFSLDFPRMPKDAQGCHRTDKVLPRMPTAAYPKWDPEE